MAVAELREHKAKAVEQREAEANAASSLQALVRGRDARRRIYRLKRAVSAWEKLVDITVFLVDMNRDFATFNRIYADYFPDPRTQPCRTTLAINRLPTPIAIELKCIASVE